MKNRPIIRQILFPTDYSDASRAAGHLAAKLARHFKAKLHVVHVVPPVTDPGPAGAMASVVAELESDVDFVTAVVFGRIAPEIVSYAGRHDIDMIVMGTRGRTSLSRAVLGSVAAAVVRRASCPVLTVPRRPEDEKASDRAERAEATVSSSTMRPMSPNRAHASFAAAATVSSRSTSTRRWERLASSSS